ncbi:MAG: hypothetical protein AAGF55_17650, partial [Pseudomonadota bacterium]
LQARLRRGRTRRARGFGVAQIRKTAGLDTLFVEKPQNITFMVLERSQLAKPTDQNQDCR